MTGSHDSTRERKRALELALQRDRAHNVTETRHRFEAIFQRVPAPASAIPTLVDAALEVARHYAMECAYANYELRTGHAYPPERREAEELQEEREWRACLGRIERLMGPAPATPR